MPGRKPRAPGLPARVRAAIAYADLDQRVVAEALHTSASTINRWMTGGKDGGGVYRAPDADQREALARLCGVPASFMHHGWPQEIEPESDLAGRVTRLEDVMTTMLRAATERADALQRQQEAGRGQTGRA